jgi:putative molybdopterin biosynthesis protein
LGRKIYIDNVPLEEALARYLRCLREKGMLNPGQPELVPVMEGRGRVTAEPVYARLSVPHYNASAMDGVAVKAADTFGASETSPVRLKLGEQGVVVDTGDPLPEGFDAVIMIEDIQFLEAETFEIIQTAIPWQHVRTVGEDVVAGELILPANHRLRPYDLGALLAGGVMEVKVHPRPRVVFLPTGTEIVEPGQVLKPGDITEFNSQVLGGMAEEWGGQASRQPITPDDYEILKKAIREAVETADLLIINAGSSAGREDYTADLIAELGQVIVHGVAIRPGKPVILGIIQDKPVLGIPGYPVSAALTFELLARPIICRKLGQAEPVASKAAAYLTRKTPSPMGVEEFVRVKAGRVGERLVITPMARGAGVISSLVRADGILRIPRFSEGVQANEMVEIDLLRDQAEIENTSVIIGSHDVVLDLIGSWLKKLWPGSGLSSAHVGSLGGLTALRRGEAHAAGIHLLDENTGEYNVGYVQRLLAEEKVRLVNLTYRQQGLMVAPGNPLGVTGFEDLTRSAVRFVNRQRGAGTRILLDYELKQRGLAPDDINGYQREEFTHMAVAAAIKAGTADVGLGILAAARALGLDFVPVVVERYDLCIPIRFWEHQHIQRILTVLNEAAFRAEVEALGGYDLRDCGRVMWESN